MFGQDDALIHSFSNPGFLFPCSIAFSEERQEAYILGLCKNLFVILTLPSLDKRQSIIFVVSPEFLVTGSICREGRRPGQLSSPTCLLLDGRGRLVVADQGNDRVQVAGGHGVTWPRC